MVFRSDWRPTVKLCTYLSWWGYKSRKMGRWTMYKCTSLHLWERTINECDVREFMDFSINQSIFTGLLLLTLSKKTFKNALKKIPRDAFCSSHVRDVFLISVAKHVQTCSKRVSDYTYPRQVVRRSPDNNFPLNCNESRFGLNFTKFIFCTTGPTSPKKLQNLQNSG